MKNKILLLFLIFLLFITPVKKEDTKILFLFYIAGDNDLYQNAIDDLNELKSQNKINSKVLILFDGIYETKIFEIDGNKEIVLKKFGNLNSGDPNLLLNFLNLGFSKYYPENVIVVLWGHGDGRNFKGGNFKGVCFDENHSDYLTIKEIKEVLEKIYKDFKTKIDILIFDACFMQTIEISYELKDYVKYIIASQTYVPLDGLPYDDIFSRLSNLNEKNLTPLFIGKEIVDAYFYSYQGGSQGKEEVQISLINTETTTKVLEVIKDILKNFNIDDRILKVRENYLIPLNDKYVDFFGFFENYITELDSIKDDLVLINKNSFKESFNGISFYFPPYYLPINLDFFKESGFERILWLLFSYWCKGKYIITSVPLPFSLLISIFPLCASTNSFVIKRPRPVPSRENFWAFFPL